MAGDYDLIDVLAFMAEEIADEVRQEQAGGEKGGDVR